MMCGGLSEVKAASDDVQQILNPHREKLEENMGKKFQEFSLLSYKTQVVAGTNYFAKVQVGDGECIHVRVYKDLQQKTSLADHQHPKSHADEIEYF